MATMKDIITSPLLLAMVIIGLLYIVGFSLVYLKKSIHTLSGTGHFQRGFKKCHQIPVWSFPIVPSLSIVVGLFVTDFGTRNSLELVAPFRYRLTFL